MKKSIDQEVQERIASDKAVGEIAIAAVAEIKSLKRKQKESPAPLSTASTKRQRQHQPDITLDLKETSEPPPHPQTKKEPRNIPQLDKFDRSSTKLKLFLNDVANIFECMPITYSSANDKILYIAALLTEVHNKSLYTFLFGNSGLGTHMWEHADITLPSARSEKHNHRICMVIEA